MKKASPSKPKATPPLNALRVRQLISDENPGAKINDVDTYALQFLTYLEAAENVLTNGTVCAHPRTGAPMENPYLKVRASAISALNKIKRLRKLDRLWIEARAHLDPLEPKK